MAWENKANQQYLTNSGRIPDNFETVQKYFMNFEERLKQTLQLHQSSQFDQARVEYENLLTLHDDHPLLNSYYAILMMQLGDFSSAQDSLQRVGQPDLSNPKDLYHYCFCLFQQCSYLQALEWIEELVKHKPDYSQALTLLSNLYLKTGDLSQLENWNYSSNPAIEINRCYAFSQKKDWKKLNDSLKNLADHKDSFPSELAELELHLKLAFIKDDELDRILPRTDCSLEKSAILRVQFLKDRQNFSKALQECHWAIENWPESMDLWHQKAVLLQELRQEEECIHAFHRARQLCSFDYLNLELNHLGALLEFERFFDFDNLLQELENKEEFSGLLNKQDTYHLLKAYRSLSREEVQEAFESARLALKINSDPQASFFLAHLHGLNGDWKDCFEHLESRYENPKIHLPQRLRHPPSWDGISDFETLIIYGEQGFGDQIQFSRYLRYLCSYKGELKLYVHPSLRDLFKCCSQLKEFVLLDKMPDLGSLPPQIKYCSIESLPYLLKLDEIPEPLDFNLSESSRTLLQKNQDENAIPRVGLCYQGNPQHRNDQNRSIRDRNLRKLLEILRSNPIELYSLQLEPSPSYRDEQLLLYDCSTFHETAQRLMSLDCVISVDTSIAHLSASLKLPTFLLLPRIPDWRWTIEGDRSIWYPSMRILRQDKAGNWSEVFHRLNDFLISDGRFKD